MIRGKPRSQTVRKRLLLCQKRQREVELRSININTTPALSNKKNLIFWLFCVQKQQNTRNLCGETGTYPPVPLRGRTEPPMKINQNFCSLGSDQASGLPHHRQDGASSPPTQPSDCREWAQGRQQNPCPLPKGTRPPQENTSRPLLNGDC